MSAASILASHRYSMSEDYSAQPGVTVDIPPPPWNKSLNPELRYPYDVLEQALPLVHARGLHFHFTKSVLHLPEYGPRMIAMLLQEERSKVPAYGRHIRATIRNLLSKPFLGYRPRLPWGRPEAVTTLEYARDWYTHLRSRWDRAHPRAEWHAPIRKEPLTLRIPLGYHSQEDVPYIPMAKRTLDIFFAGDVRHTVVKSDLQHWVSNSKFEVRDQLQKEMARLKAEGDWRMDFGAVAASEAAKVPEVFSSYSEKMMNTRVGIAPRGTRADTYRHFEALRAGCLLVSNPLPIEPYLHDAPMLVIDRWSELRGILKKYARNDDYLQQMSERSLAWWNDRLRPEVIGRYIAAELNKD